VNLVSNTTAASRYELLRVHRNPYEQRAEECARYTIPHLFPPEGAAGATNLPTPYQSVGARGLTNLASKFLLVLFPAGGSFFRMTMDDFVVEELKQAHGEDTQGFEDARATLEDALSKMERAVQNRMEQKGTRTVLFTMLLHLVLTGNGLLQVMPDGSLKFYSLRNYVVKRDLDGNVLEIVVKETLSRMALPTSARAVVDNQLTQVTERHDENPEKGIDLFTRVVRLPNGGWRVYQEIMGARIPETEGQYPKDKSAFIPLRFNAAPGEDYGRGHVEAYLGDLQSLESLTESIVGFASVSARILFLVDSGSQTDLSDLEGAPNGAFVQGNKKDISTLGLEKFADFQVAKSVADEIKQRLELAFLLSTSVQRQAERVTAEEIRFMAGELEQAQGGSYSILAQELQAPLARRQIHQMQRSGDLPRLPDKTASPQIVTGLEGLGRSSDLMKLDILIQGIAQQFGPEAVAEYVNVGAYMKRRGAALGIDLNGIVRTEQEAQTMRQQKTAQDTMTKLAPHMLNMATKSNTNTQGAPAAS
jgi:hypothetical protein